MRALCAIQLGGWLWVQRACEGQRTCGAVSWCAGELHHNNTQTRMDARYFELSSNRRDIWHGEDMTGDGRKKSNWNRALLLDVAAPACVPPPPPPSLSQIHSRIAHCRKSILESRRYARLLLEARWGAGAGGGATDLHAYYALWPPTLPAREPWAEFVKAVYAQASPAPLLHSIGGPGAPVGGAWTPCGAALVLEDAGEGGDAVGRGATGALTALLIEEGCALARVPPALATMLGSTRAFACCAMDCVLARASGGRKCVREFSGAHSHSHSRMGQVHAGHAEGAGGRAATAARGHIPVRRRSRGGGASLLCGGRAPGEAV